MNKIFLRDAGIILPKTNKAYFTKLEFFRRLNNGIFLVKKNNVDLQLTISKDFFMKYIKIFHQHIKKLKKIKNIVIHLHAHYDSLADDKKDTILFVKKLNEYSNLLGNIRGYCIHPDNVETYKILKKLIIKKRYLAIEVTDLKAKSGNNFLQIKKTLNQNKYLKLVLDTSHIEEIKKKYIKEPSIEKYYTSFKNKIVEIQISSDTNEYSKNIFGKDFKTTHSLLCLSNGKIYNILKKIQGFKNKNLVIEGVVPFNNLGKKMLKEEIHLLKNLYSK